MFMYFSSKMSLFWYNREEEILARNVQGIYDITKEEGERGFKTTDYPRIFWKFSNHSGVPVNKPEWMFRQWAEARFGKGCVFDQDEEDWCLESLFRSTSIITLKEEDLEEPEDTNDSGMVEEDILDETFDEDAFLDSFKR